MLISLLSKHFNLFKIDDFLKEAESYNLAITKINITIFSIGTKHSAENKMANHTGKEILLPFSSHCENINKVIPIMIIGI